MNPFQTLAFVRSAHEMRDLPPPAGPEVAFGGRSNAGKSSAINALAGRRRLAFVSKTPGRTQQINFFSLGSGFLVDLPGYGYAKVPGELRDHWNRVLPRYLGERQSLVGLVLIMDIRHPMTPLDVAMLEWFLPSQRPVHVLLSKADKISRREGNATLRAVESRLRAQFTQATAQLYSSTTPTGVDEARSVVLSWLSDTAQDPAPTAGREDEEGATRLPRGPRGKQKPRAEGE